MATDNIKPEKRTKCFPMIIFITQFIKIYKTIIERANQNKNLSKCIVFKDEFSFLFVESLMQKWYWSLENLLHSVPMQLSSKIKCLSGMVEDHIHICLIFHSRQCNCWNLYWSTSPTTTANYTNTLSIIRREL